LPTEQQLNRVWNSLRRRNESLPKARIVAAPDKRSVTGCWVDWKADSPPLILVAVSDDPVVTLAALLHHAAHALSPDGGIGPSSHRRWHTREYRALAAMLGLEVSGSAGTITKLNGDSAERYAAELKILSEV
jgi:hypothetical protein